MPPPDSPSAAEQYVRDVYKADCSKVDCVAIAIDGVSLVASTVAIASPFCGPFAPECATAGATVGRTATGIGFGWTVLQGMNGNVSDADALITGFNLGLGLGTSNPKVGLAADLTQFFWDTFIAPFDSRE